MTVLGNNLFQSSYDDMRKKISKEKEVVRRQIGEKYNQKLPVAQKYVANNRGFSDTHQQKEARDKMRLNKAKTRMSDDLSGKSLYI